MARKAILLLLSKKIGDFIIIPKRQATSATVFSTSNYIYL